MFKYFLYAVIGYIGAWLFVQLVANSIIFQPPRPSTYQDTDIVKKVIMQDGTKLSVVYLPNEQSKYTIFYLHGNAGDLGDFYDILRYFNQNGYAIISYDYPGYGTSSGRSTETTAYDSAQVIYDYLVTNLKIAPKNIILYGQSLGGAIALQLALHNKTAGLVMESAFLSAFRTVTQIPIFPLDRFVNTEKIHKIRIPLLMIHGTKDYEVPFWQGKSLYKRAPGPKQHYWVDDAKHDTIYVVAKEKFWQHFNRFVKGLTP